MSSTSSSTATTPANSTYTTSAGFTSSASSTADATKTSSNVHVSAVTLPPSHPSGTNPSVTTPTANPSPFGLSSSFGSTANPFGNTSAAAPANSANPFGSTPSTTSNPFGASSASTNPFSSAAWPSTSTPNINPFGSAVSSTSNPFGGSSASSNTYTVNPFGTSTAPSSNGFTHPYVFGAAPPTPSSSPHSSRSHPLLVNSASFGVILAYLTVKEALSLALTSKSFFGQCKLSTTNTCFPHHLKPFKVSLSIDNNNNASDMQGLSPPSKWSLTEWFRALECLELTEPLQPPQANTLLTFQHASKLSFLKLNGLICPDEQYWHILRSFPLSSIQTLDVTIYRNGPPDKMQHLCQMLQGMTSIQTAVVGYWYHKGNSQFEARSLQLLLDSLAHLTTIHTLLLQSRDNSMSNLIWTSSCINSLSQLTFLVKLELTGVQDAESTSVRAPADIDDTKVASPSVFDALCHMPRLQHLICSRMTMNEASSDAFIRALSHLTQLTQLELNEVHFDNYLGVSRHFHKLSRLQRINVFFGTLFPNKTQLISLSALRELPHLTELSFGSDRLPLSFYHHFAESLVHLPWLRVLKLRVFIEDALGNDLHWLQIISPSLPALTQLTELSLLSFQEYTQFDMTALFKATQRLANLERLKLSGFVMTVSDIKQLTQSLKLRSSSKQTNITHLSIESAKLQSTHIKHLNDALRHLAHLVSLDLTRNRIDFYGFTSLVQHLYHVPLLQRLVLTSNSFSNEDLLKDKFNRLVSEFQTMPRHCRLVLNEEM